MVFHMVPQLLEFVRKLYVLGIKLPQLINQRPDHLMVLQRLRDQFFPLPVSHLF